MLQAGTKAALTSQTAPNRKTAAVVPPSDPYTETAVGAGLPLTMNKSIDGRQLKLHTTVAGQRRISSVKTAGASQETSRFRDGWGTTETASMVPAYLAVGAGPNDHSPPPSATDNLRHAFVARRARAERRRRGWTVEGPGRLPTWVGKRLELLAAVSQTPA